MCIAVSELMRFFVKSSIHVCRAKVKEEICTSVREVKGVGRSECDSDQHL